MKLTKIIPARRQTVEFKWAYKNCQQATEIYLKIRNGLHKSRRGSMTRCDWCKRPFEINEWFALAQPIRGNEGPKRNWALCNQCADEMGAPERRQNETDD